MDMKNFNKFLNALLIVFLFLPASLLADVKLQIAAFEIEAGNQKEMLIELVNDKEITALQFELTLPEGLTIAKDELGDIYDIAGRIQYVGRQKTPSHSLDTNTIDGAVRFKLTSPQNVVLEGTEGAVIYIMLQAASSFVSGDIVIDNIYMAAPDETQFTQEPIVLSLKAIPTSIKGVAECAVKSAEVYDLSGRRVKGQAAKGVYIVGGRKVVK
jgi:hypothetical protein